MDIKDFADRKLKLERDIATAVSSLLLEFETETGFSPASVDVGLIEVTGLMDSTSCHRVGRVHTEIKGLLD